MFAIGNGLAEQRTATGFISKYGALLDILVRIGDVAIVLLAGAVIHRLRFHLPVHMPYSAQLLRAGVLVLLIFPGFQIYRSWRGASLGAEVLRIALAWLTVMGLLIAWGWAIKANEEFSRLWTGGWFLAALVLMAGNRLMVRAALGVVRARGWDHRRIVLVGATAAGARVLAATRNNPWLGMDVQGYVATDYDQLEQTDADCLGDFESFLQRLRSDPPDQIWVALPLRAEALIERLLAATSDIPTAVRLVPDMLGYELINQSAGSIAGVPVITLRGSRIVGHARVLKAIEDRVLAAVILFLLSPLMLAIAVAVKLSSPGPVIYRQKRHGLNGKEIDVWKFRSMRMHAERDGKVTQATKKDPRVTALGRFLRRSSLDELPQLINVLRGEMSIVGPRPHAVEHNREYSEQLRGYMQRHGAKPGITGLAQIKGFRGQTDTLDKMAQRVQMDLLYINSWSLWLDLKVVVLTPWVLLTGKNAF
ncbi:undecaprenyl-phosphate glucose phosphotransferase [Frateuria sp. STR12]|uniref:undecaprenyl-phosphate glucose phosphotransferase n=1 Tax=Frateuria hangzhouensis TaxID=2995589 RepID=UPI002260B4BC|nr:undecaprenyl-phosphate glucose phosphotransferase [Frateuria sp. STR12]MCX7515309.1 undecaprenyl-phosphate glucose phosphotransferase [Frateuria sp. STR12]